MNDHLLASKASSNECQVCPRATVRRDQWRTALHQARAGDKSGTGPRMFANLPSNLHLRSTPAMSASRIASTSLKHVFRAAVKPRFNKALAVIASSRCLSSTAPRPAHLRHGPTLITASTRRAHTSTMPERPIQSVLTRLLYLKLYLMCTVQIGLCSYKRRPHRTKTH